MISDSQDRLSWYTFCHVMFLQCWYMQFLHVDKFSRRCSIWKCKKQLLFSHW